MRKTVDITIKDDGEDKRFLIKQMSATQAQRWVMRLIMLIGGEGVKFEMTDILKALAEKPEDKVFSLLDDLTSCCSIIRAGAQVQLTPENIDGFIAEMSTLTKLQAEAFKANNFFQKSGISDSMDSPEPMIRRRG